MFEDSSSSFCRLRGVWRFGGVTIEATSFSLFEVGASFPLDLDIPLVDALRLDVVMCEVVGVGATFDKAWTRPERRSDMLRKAEVNKL